MPIFSGLDRTDYQDLLRALGLQLSQLALEQLRIREVEQDYAHPGGGRGGLIVSGWDNATHDLAFYAIPKDECHAILRDAYARRATDAAPLPLQNLLRVVGLRADTLGLVDLTLMQVEAGYRHPAGARHHDAHAEGGFVFMGRQRRTDGQGYGPFSTHVVGENEYDAILAAAREHEAAATSSAARTPPLWAQSDRHRAQQ
jgi:hypothetical protein